MRNLFPHFKSPVPLPSIHKNPASFMRWSVNKAEREIALDDPRVSQAQKDALRLKLDAEVKGLEFLYYAAEQLGLQAENLAQKQKLETEILRKQQQAAEFEAKVNAAGAIVDRKERERAIKDLKTEAFEGSGFKNINDAIRNLDGAGDRIRQDAFKLKPLWFTL